MADDMTEQDAQEILRQFSESKVNLHTFFTNVVKAKDTTKTGNLKEEEIGMSTLPVRTYQELSLFSKDIADQAEWSSYFKDLSEIQTSTSLSRDAILLKLAITQKKELADVSAPKKSENKGWFKSKNQPQDSGVTG